MIDIVQEGIERLDPLLEAVGHPLPFLSRNNARHNIKGDQALLAGLLAIHGESDADAMEGQIRFLTFAVDQFGRRRLEPLRIGQVAGAHTSGSVAHFIVGWFHVRSHRCNGCTH